jgi:hypothetical protein
MSPDIDTMAREAAQSHLSFEFSQIQSSLADIQAALGPIQLLPQFKQPLLKLQLLSVDSMALFRRP